MAVLPLWLAFNPAWKNRTSSIWVTSCRKFLSIACTCRPMSRQNSWLIRRMTSFMLKDLENGRRLSNPSIRTTLICWSYKSYLTSPPQSIHGRKLYNVASLLYPTLAHRRPTFTADMTTYYCPNMGKALRRAKKAGREPGRYFGGITLRSGQRGFAVYRDGEVVAQ